LGVKKAGGGKGFGISVGQMGDPEITKADLVKLMIFKGCVQNGRKKKRGLARGLVGKHETLE